MDASGTTERHRGRPSGSLCPSSLLTHDHFHTASSSQDRDPSGGCSHHILKAKCCAWRVVCAESFQSCPTLCNPCTADPQDPLSMGFSRQEYWRGLPFPPPGDLPNPGTELESPALQENGVLSLTWEESLEQAMAAHSSILAWRITWTEETGRLTVYLVTKS